MDRSCALRGLSPGALETVKGQPSDARDPREVLVEREDTRVMFESNGCDQGIYRGERNAFSARGPVDRGRFPIGCESPGLEQIPLRQKLLNPAGIPGEALQDLGYDHSSKYERFAVGNKPPEFRTPVPGRRTKEVHPDRAIDQNQLRFLREALRSPRQIPVP